MDKSKAALLCMLAASSIFGLACGGAPSANEPADASMGDAQHPGGDIQLPSDDIQSIGIDPAKAGPELAAESFRPGIVAYGLLESDSHSDYYGLDQFLGSTRGRGGYVKFDVGDLFRKLETEADLAALLATLDVPIARAIDNGSRVELNIHCMLPNALSKFEGYNHDVLTGIDQPSAQPIYACGPLKDRPKGSPVVDETVKAQVRATWQATMKALAEHLLPYGDKIVYLLGNEPDNYFAGDEQEFFELFEVSLRGLRSGNARARIGGVTTDYKMSKLTHISPVFDVETNTFSFSSKELARPFIQLWLEHLHQKQLAIDVIQVKSFGASPVPASSAFWIPLHQAIETWLGLNADAHAGEVELLISDFPGWHTVCAEQADGQWESIWDSEYFSAWYASTYIAMKSYIAANKGVVQNIEPLLSFLIEFGIEAFFHTSCEPDGSRPAGFGGAIGLITEKTKLPKPILHSLSLLTALDGNLLVVDQPDPNLQVIASVDKEKKKVSVLLSYFIPSELNYHTAGFKGYEWGTLFKNAHGVEREHVALEDIEPSAAVKSYLKDDDFPKRFVHDLLAGPDVLEIDSLGLPAGYAAFFAAARQAGQQHRKIRAASAQGLHKRVKLDFSALEQARYRLRSHVIDAMHGNAYTDRHTLHKELEAAQASGGQAAAMALLETMRARYGISSTIDRDEELVDKGEVMLSLRPNSVHLVVLEAQ